MFDREKMRIWIAGAWILAFAAMWLTFEITLPKQEMASTIEKLELNVQNKDWGEASIEMANLNTIWEKNNIQIHMNNAAEEVSSFRQTLGEIHTLIKNEDDSALAAIGRLKVAAQTLTTSFAQP